MALSLFDIDTFSRSKPAIEAFWSAWLKQSCFHNMQSTQSQTSWTTYPHTESVSWPPSLKLCPIFWGVSSLTWTPLYGKYTSPPTSQKLDGIKGSLGRVGSGWGVGAVGCYATIHGWKGLCRKGWGGVPNCDANIIPLSVVFCRKFN